MQYFVLSLLATLAAGSPIAAPAPATDATSTTNFSLLQNKAKAPAVQGVSIRNDLENGTASACPGSILVFARGTNEVGNIVCNELNLRR